MTAFAAVVSSDPRFLRGEAIDAMASALGAITGAPAQHVTNGPCVLLSSPLHSWDAPGPTTPAGLSTIIAGDVMLEGARDLARAARVPGTTSALEIAAHALDAWGDEATARFSGEYAFASWDPQRQRLLCARDGLGIRVLYVGESSEAMVVSNVFDAVLAMPGLSRELDEASLVRFLATGSLSTTVATPYQAIRYVPEGHTLTITADRRVALHRHWHLAPPGAGFDRHPEAVKRGFRDVLRQAVEDRVGGRRATLLLSGGLDSTAIAAVAVDTTAQWHAVSVKSVSGVSPGETDLARQVAERLSIPLDVVSGDVDPPLEAERNGALPAMFVGEPMLTNWRSTLQHAARHATLAISGEDGDALFEPPGAAELFQRQSAVSVLVNAVQYAVTERRKPYLGLRLRERLGVAPPTRTRAVPWLSQEALRVLEQPEDRFVLGVPVAPMSPPPWCRRLLTGLWATFPRDFAPSISPDVTRQRTRITLPLMDSRVMRFVLAMPPMPWCQHKHLSRRAFADVLPDAVVRRQKTPLQGFDDYLVSRWRNETEASHSREDAGGELTRWIDERQWRATVEHGAAFDVVKAWRAPMLAAWLSRRAAPEVLCTP